MENSQNIRLRRSLIDLNKTQIGRLQRRRFFWCLKMLDVLPPFSEQFKAWKYYSPASKTQNQDKQVTKVSPACLHDVLVSSHATSCQHSSLYFVHYHRHLMIMYELFINFANQIMKGGFQHLKKVYREQEYPIIYRDTVKNQSKQQKWKDLFQAYEQFNNKRLSKQISAHYWNPCNYTNDEDLTIPKQLQQKQDFLDEVDHLCKAIRNSYAWNVNVASRWFAQGNDQRKVFNGVFTQVIQSKLEYTDNQISIMEGTRNPANTKLTDLIADRDKMNQKLKNIALERMYNECQNSVKNSEVNQMTFWLNPLNNKQLKANFYASSINQQYIPRDWELPIDYYYNYNSMTPHYQFALSYAGFQSKFSQKRNKSNNMNMKYYLNPSYGLQQSHNMMHNYQSYIMSDALYSITNLVFFAYHSWVDLMLQFKIRQANHLKDNSLQLKFKQFSYLDANFPTQLNNQANLDLKVRDNIYDQSNSMLKSLLRDAIKNNSIIKQKQKLRQNLDKVGSYPIPEWVDPDISSIENPSGENISVGFFASQYMLDSVNGPLATTKLLDTRSIGKVYNYYKVWKQKRFQKFQGFKTFNFNYNYEVYDLKESKILTDVPQLPYYISVIINQTLRNPLKNSEKPMLRVTKPQNVSQLKDQTNVEVQQQELNIRKLLSSQFLVFAQYSPTTKNGQYPIKIKLKNILSELVNTLQKQQLKWYEDFQLNDGLFLANIHVFGKESGSKICYKCHKNKCYFIELDLNLKVIAEKLWRTVHNQSLYQILYDSAYPKKILNFMQNYIQLQKIDQINLKLVSGVQQIQLNVKSNAKTSTKQYIRVTAESYSVSRGDIQMVVSKKKQKLNYQFDFFKIHDVKGKNSKISLFDQFVYKTIKLTIGIGESSKSEFKQIQFKLPNYARLIRLECLITVDTNQKIQNVKIIDTDYQLKKSYYKAQSQNF